MKYIRTKCGKIVKHPHPNEEVFTFRYEILKSANNIEDLCDEWVIVFKDGHIMFDIDYEDFEKEWFKHKHNNIIANHFGAIWTDKGLIYVAKMNNEGELELI